MIMYGLFNSFRSVSCRMECNGGFRCMRLSRNHFEVASLRSREIVGVLVINVHLW